MNAFQTLEQRNQCPDELFDIFSKPVFRGTLKPRDGDRRFSRLKLDVETAFQIGTNNVGLFVENCPSFEQMVDHFYELKDSSDLSLVIVASSKQVKEELNRIKYDSCLSLGYSWPKNVKIYTPEELHASRSEIDDNLAAILVFDYACHIHKCRGFSNHRFQKANDRPQKIVDFRMSFAIGSWSPPIILFTNKKAISVNTQPMLSPYCLEAFRYIDGQTMRFGGIQDSANLDQLVPT